MSIKNIINRFFHTSSESRSSDVTVNELAVSKEYKSLSIPDDDEKAEYPFTTEECGIKVYDIPFVPEDKEVFYVEYEYDENANAFIKEHISEIRKELSKRGIKFTYIPELSFSSEEAKEVINYLRPDANFDGLDTKDFANLTSSFLLDYMWTPANRPKISSSFAWFHSELKPFNGNVRIYTFDMLRFDGKEALDNPDDFISQIIPKLGIKRQPLRFYHIDPIEPESPADDKFDDIDLLDDDTKKELFEIQSKLNSMRLLGVSESLIAKFISPRPKLSHITITHDFRIILNDYKNMEIKMEPLVKFVYILFLRHPEGILFKNMADYSRELETIYRCIKAKRNDIDKKLSSITQPKINASIASLCNPTNNSINEKCTRIKEAFIKRFHDSIAKNYYIQGAKLSEKKIVLPRELIIWEGNKDEKE